MRWKKKIISRNSRRVIKKFLFLPKTINKETRWLEFVEYIQEYTFVTFGDGSSILKWECIEWVDDNLVGLVFQNY